MGPNNQIGEGSITLALANALEANPDPKTGGTGKERIIFYIVYHNFGAEWCKIRTIKEIKENSHKLFEE